MLASELTVKYDKGSKVWRCLSEYDHRGSCVVAALKKYTVFARLSVIYYFVCLIPTKFNCVFKFFVTSSYL